MNEPTTTLLLVATDTTTHDGPCDQEALVYIDATTEPNGDVRLEANLSLDAAQALDVIAGILQDAPMPQQGRFLWFRRYELIDEDDLTGVYDPIVLLRIEITHMGDGRIMGGILRSTWAVTPALDAAQYALACMAQTNRLMKGQPRNGRERP